MRQFTSAVYSWELPRDKNPRLGKKLRQRRAKIERSLAMHTIEERRHLLQRMEKINQRLWQLTNHEPQAFKKNLLGGDPLTRGEQCMEDIPSGLPVFTYPIDRISPSNNQMSENNIASAREIIAETYRRSLLARIDEQSAWESHGQEFADSHEFNSFFIES